MLQISTSVTMASAATRDTTNTGSAAGWSARSTNGSRAMIFGALVELERGPPGAAAAGGKRRDQAKIALRFRDRLDHAGRAHVRHERHREAEMEARAVAHRCVARRQVGMHGERRLHIGEGRDDDAPDALGGVERQDAVMALHQPAHHVGLARRAERRAGFLRLLDRDQAVDDLAALHQQPVHGLVDAVDLLAQIAQRRRA